VFKPLPHLSMPLPTPHATELIPYQQRVVDERQSLHHRLERLQAFMTTETCHELPFEERSLLVRQARIMSEYLEVLSDRINLFFKPQA
jgi:hypothetical protein